MPDTTLLLEVDGAPLSGPDLDRIVDVQVEEAADTADALTIVATVEPTPAGEWTSVLDPLTSPRCKVVAEVARGDVTYRFEGRSTEAEWDIDAVHGAVLTIKAVDRSLDLDLIERIVPWRGTSDSAIASAIFGNYGFAAEVEDTPAGPDPDVHVALQRGTDLAFLRSLAAKWGYAMYLEATQQRVTGHFHPLDPLAQPQAELRLAFGGDGGAVRVSAGLTAGQRVKTSRIPVLTDTPQSGDNDGTTKAQGSRSLGGQATILLTPGDVEGEVEPHATATALAAQAAFTLTLVTEIDSDTSGILLRARRPVLVKGLGSSLSGRYLVQRVRHRFVPKGTHRHEVRLIRNAVGLTGTEPFGMLNGGGGR